MWAVFGTEDATNHGVFMSQKHSSALRGLQKWDLFCTFVADIIERDDNMIDGSKLLEIKQRFNIIGNAEGLNRAIERAYQVAPTDYSILVVGESGVGKEHFPQIVHAYSARKHAKYIAIKMHGNI